jgi:glycine dehydrogenase subunit 1
MSLMGDEGLLEVAKQSHRGLITLLERVSGIQGVVSRFTGPCFHEAVLKLPKPALEVLAEMAKNEGILGGFDLGRMDSELSDCLLVNVTEVKTETDIDRFVSCLTAALEK